MFRRLNWPCMVFPYRCRLRGNKKLGPALEGRPPRSQSVDALIPRLKAYSRHWSRVMHFTPAGMWFFAGGTAPHSPIAYCKAFKAIFAAFVSRGSATRLLLP